MKIDYKKIAKSIAYLLIINIICLVSCSNSLMPPVDNEDRYRDIHYDELQKIIANYAHDISYNMKIDQSDKRAMSMLRDNLLDIDIQTGLVTISSYLEASGNLDYCIAVNTIDRGTVFLTVLPSELELEDENERVQYVYLKENDRIGLIPAIFSESNDYIWYTNYLEEIQEFFSYTDYLEEYADIIDKNRTRLDEIYNANEKITSYIEDPPLMTQYLDETTYNRVNREFDRLIDLANNRIDRYNNIYALQFDQQVEDFNDEIEIWEELSKKYPCDMFYVEEYYINNELLYELPQFPTIYQPITFPEFPVFYTDVDQLLSALETMISEDDSYTQIQKPNRDQFSNRSFEDKNFTVKKFRIKW